jgi:hypothetical protein
VAAVRRFTSNSEQASTFKAIIETPLPKPPQPLPVRKKTDSILVRKAIVPNENLKVTSTVVGAPSPRIEPSFEAIHSDTQVVVLTAGTESVFACEPNLGYPMSNSNG